MNSYEVVFIMLPTLTSEELEVKFSEVLDVVKDKGGKVVIKEKWGLKKLKYQINKMNSGFYFLLEIEAEGNFVEQLELYFKRNTNIMRFLTVKMDKDHKEYSIKRRNRLKESKPEMFI